MAKRIALEGDVAEQEAQALQEKEKRIALEGAQAEGNRERQRLKDEVAEGIVKRERLKAELKKLGPRKINSKRLIAAVSPYNAPPYAALEVHVNAVNADSETIGLARRINQALEQSGCETRRVGAVTAYGAAGSSQGIRIEYSRENPAPAEAVIQALRKDGLKVRGVPEKWPSNPSRLFIHVGAKVSR